MTHQVDSIVASLMHYFHIPYAEACEYDLCLAWRLLKALLGNGESGEVEMTERPQTEEQKQDVFFDILKKAGQVGVKGPKA